MMACFLKGIAYSISDLVGLFKVELQNRDLIKTKNISWMVVNKNISLPKSLF